MECPRISNFHRLALAMEEMRLLLEIQLFTLVLAMLLERGLRTNRLTHSHGPRMERRSPRNSGPMMVTWPDTTTGGDEFAITL